ncbi:hypothetical protein [Methylobacterium radiotolerans]|jgi:hypothetical protein|uniref:Uncharacterized protein n=1 Tax=Methylobacterium radiotolerans (strain ATCC 27329 / DSM 1819 / JCM 2831 / NBRC 15690 / NCIMB 10815 / 0-1) TaxID=426355 RepID=B1LVY2_METRJ|nr:hypothetical protein [Methylobacterium radiotolerans]ACB25632.1 hypothetical protein Mrad2831_3656 [Methylobacterium radiotolerans JCM 2831]PVZ04071.1 hypothetical protein C7388_10896 [Methylobacterium organophilum]GAN47432.1 hypothetical protein ME121_1440 [Methylobacterium sp. ME121]KZB98820.1 hypothetical protein AU375_04984 [Methylobacterium radiotolerans]ONF50139.1 hypothetical protein RSM1_05485 [Methylobacterium radiotolerans]
MLANARDARRRTGLTSDLRPPEAGPNADPVLYGVAAGLAALFPPVMLRSETAPEPRRPSGSHPSGTNQSRDTTGSR